MPKPVKKILAVRNDRFGEFLLILPALRALKASYPGASLTLIVDPYVKELCACVPFVDEIIPWENRKYSFFEVLNFSRHLKEKGFDLCLILNPAKASHLACFLAGIPERIGYSRKWGFLLTRKLKDEKCLGKKHEVEYNFDLASLAGAKRIDPGLNLDLSEGLINDSARKFGLAAEKRFVCVHPFTSDPLKQWPQDKFFALIQRLAQELHYDIVLVGGKEEAQKAASLCKALDNKVINLAGRTSLVELACLLKRSQLLISCDSGPVHLAAEVGTPVIALFRNDLPGKTAGRWGPWGAGHRVIEKEKLEYITAEDVMRQVREVLKI